MDLMKASPAVTDDRAAGPEEDLGPVGALLVRWIPPALLLVSCGLGWLAAGHWLDRGQVQWSLPVVVAILAVRVTLEAVLGHARSGCWPLVVLYLLHLMLVALAIVLNPLICIYAFVGYLDASRYLRGPAAPVVVALTAVLSAVGQVGGVQVAFTQPWYFVGLAAVNLLLAGAMTALVIERERILAQRESAVHEIGRVNQENAQLHEQLMRSARMAGMDEERSRLSREIHDTVAQDLVGVIRQLESVTESLHGDSRMKVAAAEQSARNCLLDARRAVDALGPHQLQDAEVPEALAHVVAGWARIHRVVTTFDGDQAPHGGRNSDVLVRIAQESLANIARHAYASTVQVVLTGTAHTHTLRIVDDGRGFDRRELDPGHGLANMVERAGRVGGELKVTSRPGHGCAVTATVPR